MLFRYLHDDAFLAFSREHKHLYAACLLDLHERFFSGVPASRRPQPSQCYRRLSDRCGKAEVRAFWGSLYLNGVERCSRLREKH